MTKTKRQKPRQRDKTASEVSAHQPAQGNAAAAYLEQLDRLIAETKARHQTKQVVTGLPSDGRDAPQMLEHNLEFPPLAPRPRAVGRPSGQGGNILRISLFLAAYNAARTESRSYADSVSSGIEAVRLRFPEMKLSRREAERILRTFQGRDVRPGYALRCKINPDGSVSIGFGDRPIYECHKVAPKKFWR